MAFRRPYNLIPNDYCRVNRLINKIKNGIMQNKINWTNGLTDEIRRKLKQENDGRGIDIDKAFFQLQMLNKLSNIFLISENQQLVKEYIFFKEVINNDLQQFFNDIKNLNDFSPSRMDNHCYLFDKMDFFITYISEIANLDIKEMEDVLKSKETQKDNEIIQNQKKEKMYEELIKIKSKVEELKSDGYIDDVDIEDLTNQLKNVKKISPFNGNAKDFIFKILSLLNGIEIFQQEIDKIKKQLEDKKIDIKRLVEENTNLENNLKRINKMLNLTKSYNEQINQLKIQNYRDL